MAIQIILHVHENESVKRPRMPAESVAEKYSVDPELVQDFAKVIPLFPRRRYLNQNTKRQC